MKAILLAIASSLIGAGQALFAHANGEETTAAGDAGGGDAGGEPAKRGRGRPPKADAAAAGAATGTAAGETDEARYERNRALIDDLVKVQKKGAEVKAAVAKYSPTGLKDIPADKQKAFEADIESLSI